MERIYEFAYGGNGHCSHLDGVFRRFHFAARRFISGRARLAIRVSA